MNSPSLRGSVEIAIAVHPWNSIKLVLVWAIAPKIIKRKEPGKGKGYLDHVKVSLWHSHRLTLRGSVENAHEEHEDPRRYQGRRPKDVAVPSKVNRYYDTSNNKEIACTSSILDQPQVEQEAYKHKKMGEEPHGEDTLQRKECGRTNLHSKATNNEKEKLVSHSSGTTSSARVQESGAQPHGVPHTHEERKSARSAHAQMCECTCIQTKEYG